MALLALTLALLPMTVATTAYEVKPLDMAPDSFDDQYRGCGPAMKAALPALNHSEFQKNCFFAKGWEKAVAMWQRVGSPVSPLSSSAQAIAIVSYNMIYVHEEFNDETSVAGRSPQEYRDNFNYKTLHFLLTDALATLRAAQGQQCRCVTWAAPQYKFKANVGDIVRLGQFVLSWPCRGGTRSFFTPTMFQVQTCHGVGIQAFIDQPRSETLLIPPFEKFRVTNVIDDGEKEEIHLDSIGTYSKYNCEWLTGGSVSRAPTISEDSSWSSQPWQWPQGSSEPQGPEDICGHCYNQDSQRNKSTRTTMATTATMAALATMASMWSLRPPLAL
ncbi:PREDICTED: erythroblast NAD(P)(+)--arginine ADP-ribosyltransferase-like [Ficedula albicollis]|uniref:NAD(P)(+)--arginine ADP-ribosyltransferase n=1 Tax=Ficedula albicollis TaxID=59894 RepID=U3JGC0_FICAL|nr:PREDICTED: erythroblast NAD(P)(+)--arginine ADP-ribosyltransferase-like [Ficedula albicollis]